MAGSLVQDVQVEAGAGSVALAVRCLGGEPPTMRTTRPSRQSIPSATFPAAQPEFFPLHLNGELQRLFYGRCGIWGGDRSYGLSQIFLTARAGRRRSSPLEVPHWLVNCGPVLSLDDQMQGSSGSSTRADAVLSLVSRSLRFE